MYIYIVLYDFLFINDDYKYQDALILWIGDFKITKSKEQFRLYILKII